MQCPACHSTNIRRNKIGTAVIDRVAHVGQWARLRGNVRLATAALALGGGLQGINSFRQPWKCRDCGATFGDVAAGVDNV